MFTFKAVLPDPKKIVKFCEILSERAIFGLFTKFWIWQHCLKSNQRISGFNRNLHTQLFSKQQMKCKWEVFAVLFFHSNFTEYFWTLHAIEDLQFMKLWEELKYGFKLRPWLFSHQKSLVLNLARMTALFLPTSF